jgi:hypothetical protein
MHDCHALLANVVARRTFLVASGVGFAGLHLPSLLAAEAPAPRAGRARSTILIWLSGGASHIDTWDMKPDAPAEYRGLFRPVATSAPGLRLCEHLPRLGRQAHHLAVVRSLGMHRRDLTGDHHAGYYYNLTGHAPDRTFLTLGNNRTPQRSDWPFLGTVIGYKRPRHPYLPQVISLPEKPGAPTYTRPGQFAARLGLDYDPVYVLGNNDRPNEFVIPALSLQGDVDARRLASRRQLLQAVDQAARGVDEAARTTDYSRQQQRAFSLLSAPQTKAAFDVSREPLAVREAYGQSVNSLSMLMARRLVEAGVPFVSVFWLGDERRSNELNCASGGGWDTHGNNFGCLQRWLLPEFDRSFSALLDDLHQRGLLEQTLVLVTSEMGRKPRIGDPRSGGVRGAGRDHWTHCMSVLLAGGGIRGGQAYGTSDRVGGYPDDRPTAPEDIAKTVYYAMGIEDLEAVDREGRPFHLLPEGTPLRDLF